MERTSADYAALTERHFVPFDENGFTNWIVDAKASDCIAYYRGHVGRDRCESASVLNYLDCRKLAAVSRRVMIAADHGLVLPFQRRVGEDDYVYLAVRTIGRRRLPSQDIWPRELAS